MKKLFKKLSGLDRRVAEDKEEYEEEEYYEEELGETDDSEQEEEEEDDDDEEDEEEGEDEDEDEKAWLQQDYEEGQLSIDVYQTPDNIMVKSTIAGVKPEDIDISINNDMLTIRGKRSMLETVKDENYLFRECYWGSFSRSIILPVEIESDKIDACLENGVLTVTLPKAKNAKQISIKVKEK